MSMYDYLVVKMPLPGVSPSWLKDGHAFQTKCLDSTLDTYTIEADGKFSDPSYTGKIEFYDSNIVGSGPAIYTQNGEDAESISYEVEIVQGAVTSLVQSDYTAQAAYKIRSIPQPTAENIQAWKARTEEDVTGKRLYVLWGGQVVGYWVKVLVQRKLQLVVEHEADSPYHEKGSFEILDSRDIGHTLWESAEEAFAKRNGKLASWNRERDEYAVYVASNGGIRHARSRA